MGVKPRHTGFERQTVEPNLAQLIGGALMLNRAAFEAIEQTPNGTRDALIVLMLAGASESVGQSAVLFFNHVSRLRFVIAIATGGIGLACEALIWTVGMRLVAGMLDAPPAPSLTSALYVIGLAYSPLLFGFLAFLPTLGVLLERLLRVWVFLAAVVGATVVFAMPPPAAALTAASGLLARPLLLYLGGKAGGLITRSRLPRSTRSELGKVASS
jgi:hypothetical protein